MSFHDLPSLTQLTASIPGADDPIEMLYLNSSDRHQFQQQTRKSLSSIEYHMGMNFGEIKLNIPLNIVYVRFSIKALMEEHRLTLIPMDEVVDKIYNVQTRNHNRKRTYDRTRLTEILPKQEYEYRLFMSSALDTPLSIIMSDGSRRIYRPTYQDIPHFRSSVHPLFVTCHAAQILENFIVTLPVHPPPQLPRTETRLMVIDHYWLAVPPTFIQNPDWYQDLCHPLEQISQEQLVATYTPLPDIDPELEVRVARRKPKLVPAQWVKKMRKRIERKLPFDKRVTNEKQLRLYAKEKSRPYEEVMRASHASVPFAPYLKHRPRSTDDIELRF